MQGRIQSRRQVIVKEELEGMREKKRKEEKEQWAKAIHRLRWNQVVRDGYVTRRSLLASLAAGLMDQRLERTASLLSDMRVTAPELRDADLALISKVQWVRLSSKGQAVSRTCRSLLSHWKTVLNQSVGGE